MAIPIGEFEYVIRFRVENGQQVRQEVQAVTGGTGMGGNGMGGGGSSASNVSGGYRGGGNGSATNISPGAMSAAMNVAPMQAMANQLGSAMGRPSTLSMPINYGIKNGLAWNPNWMGQMRSVRGGQQGNLWGQDQWEQAGDQMLRDDPANYNINNGQTSNGMGPAVPFGWERSDVSGGGGRRSGLFNNYFGRRFLALSSIHAATQTIDAARQYNVNSLVAGPNQSAQLEAQLTQMQQLDQVGFGLAGVFRKSIFDPLGTREAGIVSMKNLAASQDAFTAGMAGQSGLRTDTLRAGVVASSSGAGRDIAVADSKLQEASDKALAERNRQSALASDQYEKLKSDNDSTRLGRAAVKMFTGRMGPSAAYAAVDADDRASEALFKTGHAKAEQGMFDATVAGAKRIRDIDVATATAARSGASDLAASDTSFNNSIKNTGFASYSATRKKMIDDATAIYNSEKGDPTKGAAVAAQNFNAAAAGVGAFDAQRAYASQQSAIEGALNVSASAALRTQGRFSRSAAIQLDQARAGYDPKTNRFVGLPYDPKDPNYATNFATRANDLEESYKRSFSSLDDNIASLREGAGGDLAASKLSAQGFFRAAAVRKLVGDDQTQLGNARRAHLPDDIIQSMRETAINNLKGIQQGIYQNGSAAPTNAFLGGVNFGDGQQVLQVLQEINNGIKNL